MRGRGGRTAGAVALALGLLASSGLHFVASGSEPWTVAQPGARSVPVVMIVFDELPLGTLLTEDAGIDSLLFPNFARLADSSTWFRNATSPAPFTREALPAILRGIAEPLPDAPPDPVRNLFTLLGRDHPIRSAGTNPDWCDPALCNLRVTASPLQGGFHLYRSAERGRHVSAFLEALQPKTSSFYFMHLVMPHGPWRYLPSGQRYPEPQADPGEVNPAGRGKAWGPYPWLVRLNYQRHLLQTMLTDRALGSILDRLEETGLMERALTIVVADHGLGFEAGETKRVVTAETVGHVAPVPLFVKLPGESSSTTTDLPVETTDIPATVADILELDVGPDGDGRSMFGGSIPPARPRLSGGVPISSMGHEVFDLVRFKYETFRRSGDSIDPFSAAPEGMHHLLVRRAPWQVPVHPQIEVAATLGPYENTSPSDNLFPALFEGRVVGLTDTSSARLAIAVNGRIAAVTRTDRLKGTHRFYALLNPDYFGAPPNRIEIFVVERERLVPAIVYPDVGPITDAIVDN